MPYKFETDKIKMPKSKDKRRKLTDEQREEIKELYGKISQRKLAEEYGVSRRTIQFIGDPDKRKANREKLKERGGSMIYYDKEKHTESIREHRRYKQEVLKNEEN